MGNHLPDDVKAEIQRRYAAGETQRAIAQALGVAKGTVAANIDRSTSPKCKCGGPSGHKGWCKFRLAGSLARQATMAKLHGKDVDFEIPPPPKPVYRLDKSVNEKLIWLGLLPSNSAPIKRSFGNTVISLVYNATKRVKYEVRDDVRQHMILSALDGRLDIDDINRAMPTFYRYYMNFLRTSASSLDAQAFRGSTRTRMETYSEEQLAELWDDLFSGVGVSAKNEHQRRRALYNY